MIYLLQLDLEKKKDFDGTTQSARRRKPVFFKWCFFFLAVAALTSCSKAQEMNTNEIKISPEWTFSRLKTVFQEARL